MSTRQRTSVAGDEAGEPDGRLLDPARMTEVRAVMSRHVAVLRDAGSLATAAGALGAITRGLDSRRRAVASRHGRAPIC